MEELAKSSGLAEWRRMVDARIVRFVCGSLGKSNDGSAILDLLVARLDLCTCPSCRFCVPEELRARSSLLTFLEENFDTTWFVGKSYITRDLTISVIAIPVFVVIHRLSSFFLLCSARGWETIQSITQTFHAIVCIQRR